MATQFVEGQPPHLRGEGERRVEIVSGTGSMAEALGAAAATVLAILGLAGVLSGYMATIATIVLGGVFLLAGGTAVTHYHRLAHDVAHPSERHHLLGAEVGGGMNALSLAGLAGLALGILSLLGVAPHILEPVAMIAFGAGLLLGSVATSRLHEVHVGYGAAGESTRSVLRELGHLSASGNALAGIAVIVLGILALLGIVPLTLTLVAVLVLGFAMLMSSSAFGARMLAVRHPPAH
jgi:hypothetical protein